MQAGSPRSSAPWSASDHRTASLAAARLEDAGFEVTTGVGGTGVVGVLSNGDGPAVMLRADMDALPVAEQTGLDYASTQTTTDPDGAQVPVMHACGHDMHVTWLVGATAQLAASPDAWSGTVLAVFQPAEETAAGAQGMIDDGLFERSPKPRVILGQHVMPGPAGNIAYRPGTNAGRRRQPPDQALRPRRARLHARVQRRSRRDGRCHRAAPADHRLREIAATQPAVVTIGSIQSGTKDNVIPDDALLKLNVRTFDEDIRAQVLAAIERIVNAEAAAAGAPKPPQITTTEHYPLLSNDPAATTRVAAALRDHFGDERVHELAMPYSASEDFGSFGTEWGVPSVFWYVGGTDRDLYTRAQQAGRIAQDIPTNHNPRFAPVIQPTLETGIEAMTTAALDALVS